MEENVKAVTQAAQGISDYGALVMIGAVYIILSALVMIAIFKWFKEMINTQLEQQKEVNGHYKETMREVVNVTKEQNIKLNSISGDIEHQDIITNDYKTMISELLTETRKQNDMLADLSEGMKTETKLRIRNISGFAFDLAVEQVCRIIKKVREENHIVDKERTKAKIRNLITNIHEDRKSRFDPFNYRGKCISSFCNSDWIEQVSKVVESEIYNEQGADNSRAYTNVKMIYDKIKIEFYHRLNNDNEA